MTSNVTNGSLPGRDLGLIDDHDAGIYLDVITHLQVVTTVIALLGVSENMVVLGLFIRKSSAVITERGGFTISLAASDCLLSLTWLIRFIVDRSEVDGLNMFTFGKITDILQWGSATTSLWSLFSLVMDRFLNVRYPFDHERRVPKSRIPFICVGIWVVSFLVNAMQVLPTTSPKKMYITLVLFPRVPPALGTIISYLLIHCIAVSSRRRLSRQRSENGFSPVGTSSWITRLRDIKKSVLLFSVTCTLSLFGAVADATVQVIHLRRCGVVCPMGPDMDVMFILHDTAVAIIILSTALNPWVHTFRQRELWKPCYRRFRSRSKSGSLSRPYSSRTERSTFIE